MLSTRALRPLGRAVGTHKRACAAVPFAPLRHCSQSSSKPTTPPSRDAFQLALDRNQRWAESTTTSDSSFFTTLAKGQAPQLLWLGCCDSRVPETTLLGLRPGDVFTHRSIANIINPTDLSLLAAVEYAVRHIGVQHIIVCGHTSCGGVNAAIGNSSVPIVELWLQPLRALREQHAAELEKLDTADRVNHLAKLNVQAGVQHLLRVPTVIEAMAQRGLKVHGVLLHLATGRLEELDCAEEEDMTERRLATFGLK